MIAPDAASADAGANAQRLGLLDHGLLRWICSRGFPARRAGALPRRQGSQQTHRGQLARQRICSSKLHESAHQNPQPRQRATRCKFRRRAPRYALCTLLAASNLLIGTHALAMHGSPQALCLGQPSHYYACSDVASRTAPVRVPVHMRGAGGGGCSSSPPVCSRRCVEDTAALPPQQDSAKHGTLLRPGRLKTACIRTTDDLAKSALPAVLDCACGETTCCANGVENARCWAFSTACQCGVPQILQLSRRTRVVELPRLLLQRRSEVICGASH